MSTPLPNDSELQFLYFGLFRALQRYRTTTLLGWGIVLIGFASIPLGWNTGSVHGLVDLALSASTMLAGLLAVQQSTVWLESYVRIRFPLATDRPEATSFVSEAVGLMKDIDEGGWQEAYAAIGRLRQFEKKYGLPQLDR